MSLENDIVLAMLNGNTDEHDARRMIRELKAQAWDEGQEALLLDTNHNGKRMRVTPNPYRGGQ